MDIMEKIWKNRIFISKNEKEYAKKLFKNGIEVKEEIIFENILVYSELHPYKFLDYYKYVETNKNKYIARWSPLNERWEIETEIKGLHAANEWIDNIVLT